MSVEHQTEETEISPEQQAELDSRTAVMHSFPAYTVTLLVSILVVTAVQIYAGLGASVLAAGLVKPDFIFNHEYWRVLTSATLHGGLLHIAMNGYALFMFGQLFEMLSNRAHFALVFLLSAVGGGLLSVALAPEALPSVGASGGIVGLISYLAVYAFRRRKFISAEFRKNLLINIGFILIFGIILYQIIDNYGHIGGLIVGAFYGFFQIPSDEYVDPRVARPVTEILGLAALGTYIAASLFSIYLILI